MTLWDGPNEELSEKLGTEWPKNSNLTYRGWISTFYALQWSRNAATVDLIINCTGIAPVIQTVFAVFFVSMLASLWPAWRATRMQPVTAIRED